MGRRFELTGELSFGSPPFLFVTWKIPVFFQLLKKSECHLESPEFSFADGRYRLRLLPKLFAGIVDIKLVNLNGTAPENDVSYEVGLMSGTGKEIDIDLRDVSIGATTKEEYFFTQRSLMDYRDTYFPDGTLTVFCSVRLREPSSAGCPKSGGAETQVFPNAVVSSPKADSHKFIMVGELSSWSPPFLHVTWKIPGFFRIAKGTEFFLESPEFPFADGLYCLRLFSVTAHRHAKFELLNMDPSDKEMRLPGAHVSYDVALKSITGKEIDIRRKFMPFKAIEEEFTISRAQLNLRKKACFPDGTLTVFFFVRLRQPKSGGAEIPQRMRGIFKLQSDYRQLLQKETESDASFIVCGREFRVHRCVLRARSPVFDAMFGQETAEKASGLVVVDDIAPKSFEDFLEYLYTGNIRAGLSDDNVLGLCMAAEKYDVTGLKSHCVAYLRGTLSVDSFCDFMTVALRNEDEKMLSQAVRFFKVYVDRIIVTVKWRLFVTANGMAANKLLMEAGVPTEH